MEKKVNKYIIYGAQAIALGTYKALKVIEPEWEIECFVVSEMDNNASTLAGIPVLELSDYVSRLSLEEKETVNVLIATPEIVMPEILKGLNGVGLYNFIEVDSVYWADMQRRAFMKSSEFIPLSSYDVGIERADVQVFKMMHNKASVLSSDYIFPEYVLDLQVGAVFSDVKFAEYTDDSYDNISEKNGNYSELTGLYWMWKNRIQNSYYGKECYFGLAHYRRFLEMSDDDLLRLKNNNIDVVLPYPMPYEPNIEEHHKRYITETEWSGVLQALEELEPEYAKEFNDILEQEYLFNYNVILAKSEVLNQYCSWLFPLLFRIEEINNPDGMKEANRYIGYVGETLETLYFMYNRDELKIAHTGCRFLV